MGEYVAASALGAAGRPQRNWRPGDEVPEREDVLVGDKAKLWEGWGLVHYPEGDEDMELLERAQSC